MNESTLTPMQQRFCDEYLVDVNGKAAATRAGYSPKTAVKKANKLLKLPKVQQYLSEKRASIKDGLDLDPKQILKEYARIAFFDVSTLYDENEKLKPLNELAPGTKAAIGVEIVEKGLGAGNHVQLKRIKVSMQNKLAALNALAKHMGLFEKGDKEIPGTGGPHIVFVGDQQLPSY